MNFIPVLFILVTTPVALVSSWDPDAGIVLSYTKRDNVTVQATSGGDVGRVIDGNDNTNWVSGSCLPSYYLHRSDVNILLNACESGRCTTNGNVVNTVNHATDGDPYTTVSVSAASTTATFSVMLETSSNVKVISLSGKYNSETKLFVLTSNSRQQIKTLNTSNNYQNINSFIKDDQLQVTGVEIESSSEFLIKELGAIGPDGCSEEVKVDLGEARSVGTVRTRHWAGTNSASALALMLSADGHTWTQTSLEPNALHAVTTTVKLQIARYIKLRYSVNMKNYNKVYCYEIDAWDANGIWGPSIAPKPAKHSFRDMLGVNGIWGWGNQKYSYMLGPGEGPFLYNAIASHARNYHNLNWDVTDPDLDPEYMEMAAGRGTQAMGWLNWDREYQAWRNANMTIDASIQFTNKTMPDYVWDTPEQSARHYGQEFANHFGSEKGNGLISAIEVGNEPWDYDAPFYAAVLRGMSAGVKSVDTSMIVVPATFQAENKDDVHTYIGTRVLEDVATNIDVINCHTYSFINDNNGVRRGTYPENKLSSFNNIRPLSRWRDVNTPNKPLWVTEWGWDSHGVGENCSGTECVSERAQAIYAVRGLMLLARSNIERATWYFYANTDCETLFCRSGLTSSHRADFKKKTVFTMFEALLSTIGESYFQSVWQESADGYIYTLSRLSQNHTVSGDLSGHVPPNTSHIIAWLPIDADDTSFKQVTIPLPHDIHSTSGIRFTGFSSIQPIVPISDFSQCGQNLTFVISTEPCLITLQHGTSAPIVG
ncbi:uncharacterized protein LOC128231466 isoform X2 [Mya arenaria]|nr:uncharacterized protein LOC128231466 isoform X2 [Mya arenaria]